MRKVRKKVSNNLAESIILLTHIQQNRLPSLKEYTEQK